MLFVIREHKQCRTVYKEHHVLAEVAFHFFYIETVGPNRIDRQRAKQQAVRHA